MASEYDSVSSADLGPEMEASIHRWTQREDVTAPAGDVETVIGDDDRKEVFKTTASPWRYICSLRITMPRGIASGTGWLISPRVIVTAGHCLYDLDKGGGAAISIEAAPARQGSRAPFGVRSTSNYHVLQGWVKGQGKHADYASIQRFDYGAVVLDAPFDGLGSFSFAAIEDDAAIRTEVANIAGYPDQRDGSAKDGKRLFWHARPVKTATATVLEYDIDTFEGQSGSPVWVNLDGKRYVVGIHTRGVTAAAKLNGAVRITPDVFEVLKKWKAGGA